MATLPSPGAIAVATAAMVSSDKAGGSGCLQCLPELNGSVLGESRANHQVDVPTAGMAPLAKLLSQGLMGLGLLLMLERDQTLMHQIEGVVDELSGLFGGHGIGCSMDPVVGAEMGWSCSARHRI
jgi:hypothetical protein